MIGLKAEYSVPGPMSYSLLEAVMVSCKEKDQNMLGSSRRWLQREVETYEGRKERKEMVTIQRLNLKTALVSSTS